MDDELLPTEAGRSTVRLSDPGQVAAGLPALLGFRPVESVVLVSLGGASGNRVGLTVRADIPAPVLATDVARALARGVASGQPAGVLVAVVSETPDQPTADQPTARRPGHGEQVAGTVELPHRGLVHALVLALGVRDIPVRDALLVRGGRWWSYDCPHACCRPGAGTRLPVGVGELEVASVVAGQVLARDRDELRGRLAAPAGPAAAAMAAATLRVGRACSARVLEHGFDAVAEESWTAVTAALAELRRPGPARLTDDVLARLTWGLRDIAVRDRALSLALGPDSGAAELLWTECTRRAPAPLDAAPATLLAVHAWLRGDGTMAGIALDRALDSDPRYRLAELLCSALQACLPPEKVRRWLATVLAEDGAG